MVCAVVGLFALAAAALPPVNAAFFATTSNGANSLTAAASFPDYPTTVVSANPLFYHRLDDPAGSVTATDSSGNALTGVYSTSRYSQNWTGVWPMDDGAGATAKDMSGVAATHDLTRSGAAWTTSGRSRSALSFNGTSDYAATAASVVTTNATFMVSAWVYLTSTAVSRTALSQDGTTVSGFELGYDQPTNRWVFAMPRSNSAAAVVDKATSGTAPSTSTWTQLTATYNSSTNAMNLYVNGVGTSATFSGTAWDATGVLQVGAGKVTSRTHFWQGSIDSVRTHTSPFNIAATARELTIGASGGAGTSWQLDENTATTAADSSGHLNTGTLGSAASWGTARSGASSVDLPGNTSGNGYVAGSASGVTTSASFSVAAWVYLDHTTLGAMSRVAVSQSGNVKSGFMLRYNHFVTQWEFALTRDAADGYVAVYDSSTSAGLAVLNTWTHLVGVYDSVAQTATLYVNGVAQTPAAHTSPFTATGALQAGRVKEFGDWQVGAAGLEAWGPWAGRLDDIRVYRRALDQPEITAVYNGGSAYTTIGLPGALQGSQQGQTSSTAMAVAAIDSRVSFNPTTYTNPTTYSLECWFRTGGAAGAVTLMSFGNKVTGNSTTSDRRLLLDASGRVVAGTSSGVANMAQSTATYIDSAWHHAVATVSPGTGINLYVDGALVNSAAYAAPANYTGYWRWGGETWNPGVWPGDYYHLGEIDEVAVYGSVLTAQQVARNYHANH